MLLTYDIVIHSIRSNLNFSNGSRVWTLFKSTKNLTAYKPHSYSILSPATFTSRTLGRPLKFRLGSRSELCAPLADDCGKALLGDMFTQTLQGLRFRAFPTPILYRYAISRADEPSPQESSYRKASWHPKAISGST